LIFETWKSLSLATSENLKHLFASFFEEGIREWAVDLMMQNAENNQDSFSNKEKNTRL